MSQQMIENDLKYRRGKRKKYNGKSMWQHAWDNQIDEKL